MLWQQLWHGDQATPWRQSLEEILEKMGEFELDEADDTFYNQLMEAVEVYDADACENILNEMKR